MNSKQYAVLGLGIFGSTVATTLAEYGCEVIAVDQDESCVDVYKRQYFARANFNSSIIDFSVDNISDFRMVDLINCRIVVVMMKMRDKDI